MILTLLFSGHFLIFLLNFIPTIGSLLATLFPVAFSLLQFGEFTTASIILIIVSAIQVVIGNLIEPRWMGNSMNISPLVSILSLMFWGLIWGTTGMIISVPFTVVVIIILSEIESTRPLAILLSEKETSMKKTILDKSYWDYRYINQQTDWDLGEISPPIKKWFDEETNKELAIIVPGAGSGYEVTYGFEKGFKNIYYLDLSSEATYKFKINNPKVPRSHILNCDFF